MKDLHNRVQSLMNRMSIQDEQLSPQVLYQVNLLRIIIYGNIIATLLLMIYGLFGNASERVSGFIVALLVLALNLFALRSIKGGNTQTVSRIIIGVGWLSIVLGSYNSGGLYSSGMMGLVGIVVISSLLLDTRARIILYMLTIVSFFSFLFIELSGNLPYAPFKDLPFRMVIVCTTATILFLLVNYHLYAIRESERQLSQLQVKAERFRVQRELTQDLAHDLRTPLSSLQTTAYLVRQRYERDMPIDAAVEKLEDQIKRMNSMIEDLFQMTLLDVDDKKRTLVFVNLNTVLESCIKNAEALAQSRQITISFANHCQEAHRVLGDQQQLTRVFENLIQNAIHYGRTGGFIKISLRFDSTFHVVSVEDNGIGIAREYQDKVFERFYRVDSARTHRENQGAGVGLSAVQRIVQFHEGTINLTSKEGQGSVFTVTLPSIDHMEFIPK